jgi:hypothetical protein
MNDYIYGIHKENESFSKLQKQFGKTLKKVKGKYSRFDFEGENMLVELKSRRCSVKKFRDTMVGLNKLEYARKHPEKDIYFCFNFEEGLFYHKYDPEREYSVREAGRTDRGRDEMKTYFFIDCENLIKVLE